MVRGRVTGLAVSDVRFPTSLGHHGSDAMHPDPDYSAAYVVIETDARDGLKGYGLTFTLGKGTEVVVCAVNALSIHVVNKDLEEIVSDFRGFYRQLTSDGQLRWIGPEKGAVHLATAAVLNAVWDLWAKQEGKPLWKLLVDMDPKQLLSCIDFRYITDALTEEEAHEILQNGLLGKKKREEQVLKHGYPAYTTSCAWLGYPDQQLKQLCTDALKDGWTRFKVKVGADLQDDIRRCRLIREMIGPDKTLALAPLGIGVATGEQCHNRVIFKQLLQAKALSYLQIDSCRLGSVNENLSVLLMAKKFQIPVCPHAGGVGLCELVQHLIIFDYISVSGSLENRMCEYVDHLHEHFKYPVVIQNASYVPPQNAGYSTEMKEDSARKYQFPQGEVWQKLLSKP
ncbi:mitochondrial enolase superfamily member 1 isoform X2 [Dermochelys coriacea]|uniref:mitochondrial enolase superfamily member 1 isoform X2 n=1 Tax=Dermochelys coriacea TaxID=27794 RepID=UPI0018E84363|nr:mitochondrial enolase superfamily member 1 isoform X2 [Dermochelys coriacea]